MTASRGGVRAVDEEAGFIAAMLADPDDRTVLLVYADWLDERNDPRGEYLRLLVAENPSLQRLSDLGETLDSAWRDVIIYRHFTIGTRVRITFGPFAGREAKISSLSTDRRQATVTARWTGSVPIELQLWQVELIERET